MIKREQLKQEIDSVSDAYLEILYHIIQMFKVNPMVSDTNLLQGSVIFEGDLISPIEDTWDVE